MQKLLGIQICDLPTDRRTDTVSTRVGCPRLTRPDTRLSKSGAGGQGPYLRSLDRSGRSSEVKEIKSKKE